tara:strand:+ start:614 stop:1153 length:540 start_codon:yes stop_codon:yes gene_type:complete
MNKCPMTLQKCSYCQLNTRAFNTRYCDHDSHESHNNGNFPMMCPLEVPPNPVDSKCFFHNENTNGCGHLENKTGHCFNNDDSLCSLLDPNPVEDTLNTRGSNYGSVTDNANMIDKIISALAIGEGYMNWTPTHRHCVYMMVVKLTRMACGNPNHSDNPHDVAGYAKLLEDYVLLHKGGQ